MADQTLATPIETTRRLRRRPGARRESPLPGLISVAAGLLVWQMSVIWLEIPAYVLPEPLAVWHALVDGLTMSPFDRASFWFHLRSTLQATVLGFLIGSTIGVVLAALMAESRLVERLVLPYVVGIQSIPKIAIAPLFIIWFGYQSESKIAMSAVLTLFPVLLNSLQGFSTTDRDRIEVMKALKASRWQTFVHIRLPSALPLIFAGLSLGIVYAQLGTIVSEFVGAQQGMGVIMMQLQAVSDTAGVFAILVVLAVTGFTLISVMRLIHRRIVFWEKGAPRTPQS